MATSKTPPAKKRPATNRTATAKKAPTPKKRPKTGGRKKGTPNKATREIREIARPYGPEAIEKLADLMRGVDSRVALNAASALLDRGFGRPSQHIEGELHTTTTTRALTEYSDEELLALLGGEPGESADE